MKQISILPVPLLDETGRKAMIDLIGDMLNQPQPWRTKQIDTVMNIAGTGMPILFTIYHLERDFAEQKGEVINEPVSPPKRRSRSAPKV